MQIRYDNKPGYAGYQPVYLFDRWTDFGMITKSLVEDETDVPGEAAIYCAQCHNLITAQNNAVERAGQHIHTFANPAGISFTIGCFTRARCLYAGEPSLEWTWFPPYAWQYALCSDCQTHLGWVYQATGKADTFYGLILTRLISDQLHT
ncbi:MAG: cereblon family protein [Gammaproteobacteria bacterium]|nr:cereblon family protein [Gammaproteobacteria bacterium]MDH5651114.1 cereblon family protein [Gammaproteobacteria bacterium]